MKSFAHLPAPRYHGRFHSRDMLKIGSVKWRGKCSKHPGFDPVSDGPAAVRGNCVKCSQLCEIYEHHQSALRLMRNFQPVQERRKQSAPSLDHLQQNLFA